MSAIATLPKSSDMTKWTPEEKAAIEAAGLVFKHTYGAKEGQREPAPRAVVVRFMHTCQRTGLDPLAKQIYAIGRLAGGVVEWSIQTAIDGFRVIAERSGKYAGQDAAEWLTGTGEWVPVFVKAIHGEYPLAARVAVHRSDWPGKPAIGIATWDEYAQYTSKGALTKMWSQRGPGQLAKCAEALALRKAFPQDLSGIYAEDEMRGQSEEPLKVETDDTDWGALLDAATSLDEINDITEAIAAAGAGNDDLRVRRAARIGVLQAETNIEDAEEVNDDGVSEERLSDSSGAGQPSATSEPGADGAVDQGSEPIS